jgi:hypothetical protein
MLADHGANLNAPAADDGCVVCMCVLDIVRVRACVFRARSPPLSLTLTQALSLSLSLSLSHTRTISHARTHADPHPRTQHVGTAI